MRGIALGAIAEFLGCPLVGDSTHSIDSVAPLGEAGPNCLAFLDSSSHASALKLTSAGLVLLRAQDAPQCPVSHIIVSDPKLAYARVLTWLLEQEAPPPAWGRHPSSVIGKNFQAPDNIHIGPFVVIGDDVCLGSGVVIEPGAVLGNNIVIGEHTRVGARVVLTNNIRIGARCTIHPGAVLGSAGFGFANDKGRWVRIPQVGGLEIGHDVEVGANTTIDCGAQTPTIIHDGVILDNQIQIGHNVVIGKNTALAGCVGVAGSTSIGAYCLIGGGSGIGGHLEICNGVQIAGMSGVAQSITQPGVYASGTIAAPLTQWKRNALRFNQLDEITQRLRGLEKELPVKQK